MLTAKQLIVGRQLARVAGGRDIEFHPADRLRARIVPGPGISTTPAAWWDCDHEPSVGFVSGFPSLLNTLADRSGSGNDATRSGNDLVHGSPTTVFRGRAAMWFPSSTTLTSALSASDTTETSFFVGMVRDLSGNRPLIGGSGSDSRLIRIEQTSGKIGIIRQFVTAPFTTTSIAVQAGVPFVVGVILNATTAEVWVNGASESGSAALSFAAGRSSRIGQDVSAGQYYTGWLGEAIVYGSALSAGDFAQVYGYLRSKWGV